MIEYRYPEKRIKYNHLCVKFNCMLNRIMFTNSEIVKNKITSANIKSSSK